MADVQALDAKTGQPISLPQEAVAAQYAKGAIYFPPGARVPVKLNGQEGTVPEDQLDDAIHEGGAELNYDPTGAVKAGAVGAARGASFGLTDWLAIEGQRIAGGDEAAEHTRKTLEGLREAHPTASTAGEIGGAIAGAFIPGAGEAEAGRAGELAGAAEGAGDAMLAAKDAAQTAEAAQAAGAVRQASDAARAAAQADATSGRTVGSALGSLFRHANPSNALGQAGRATEDFLTPLFGGKAATLGRFATEGAIVDVANAADEDELGDPGTTGESYLASIEHGALWGSALGLVGVAGERAATGASRIASRIAEGRLGGTAGQYRKALERWGLGVLGDRMLEDGIVWPGATGSQMYDRAEAVAARDGNVLDRIAREADAKYTGMDAAEGRKAYHEAIDEARERGLLAGGNLDALTSKLKAEYDKAIGWGGAPSPLEAFPADAAERLYEQKWRAEAEKGLLPPDAPEPKAPPGGQIRALWREMMDREGLSPRMERAPKGVPAAAVEALRQDTIARFRASADLGERQRLGVMLATPGAMEQAARAELEAGVAARNAQREALRTRATDEMAQRYKAAHDTWQEAMERHQQLRADADHDIATAQGERDRQYAHFSSAVNRANADLRVSYQKVRAFRAKLDHIIPYARPTDAVTSAAIELKKAARRVLEAHVEASMDAAAARGGAELLPRYQIAKLRYGQAKDIERMLERQRAREASRFGREVFGHNGGIIGHAIGGLVFGHPFAGAAAGVARKYAPPVVAWAVHKLSRMATLRAMRSELEVAIRRSTRAAVAGREVQRFSSVALPELPPHELRDAAAKAMTHVLRDTSTDLPGRIAAMDPSLSILTPNTHRAVEGSARRAMAWMISSVPDRIKAMVAAGHEPSGRDLSNSEAHSFLEGAAVAHDPRFATDALAHGQLTPAIAAGFKAVSPSLAAQSRATLAREMQTASGSLSAIPPVVRAQAAMLGATMPGQAAAMTSALQGVAKSSGAQPAGGGGKINASAGGGQSLLKMTAASMSQTATQALEGSTPGRRGRRSAAGSTGL